MGPTSNLTASPAAQVLPMGIFPRRAVRASDRAGGVAQAAAHLHCKGLRHLPGRSYLRVPGIVTVVRQPPVTGARER